MKNIDNLTESELLELDAEIKDRLKKIEKDKLDDFNRKNNVKTKTKLSQLTNRDRILGIRFTWDKDNGTYLKEFDQRWIVDIVDYCDVSEYTDKRDRNSELNRIGFSHKTKTFGISTSITDEEAEKPYYLHIDADSSGYDGFFTIFPESWQSDIQEAFKDTLKKQKKWADIRNKKMKAKINLVLNSADEINELIKNL